jgi:hypothetical protein
MDRVEAGGHANEDKARQTGIDESAMLTLGGGAIVHGRLVELSMEGGSVEAKEKLPAIAARQRCEVCFKVKGMPFRFNAILEPGDAPNRVDVRFVDVSDRRWAELGEAIRDIEADKAREKAKAAANAPASAAATPAAQTSAPQAGHPHPEAHATPRDRRQQMRRKVDNSADIHFIRGGSAMPGRIQDLSPNGCCIHTEERFPVGIYTRVEVEFRLYGLPFRLSGVVQAIHNRDKVGIRFLDMSSRKQEQVVELINEIDSETAEQPPAASDKLHEGKSAA